MATLDFRQRPEYIRGRTGEQRVAEFLQQRGFYVIPSYDYSGEDNNKAPKLQGKQTAYVIPDLDVCRAGLRRWVEVKTKSEATLWRKTNQLQHGIDERHFNAYLAVQQETGSDVHLAVFELTPREVVLIASLERLAASIDHRGTSKGAKMIYWDRSVFHEYELPPEPDA